MDHPMTAARFHRVSERPRYYARQLVTPAELNLEASYFIDRLRRHNRLLHGWGVICGALVCRVAETEGGGAQPWKVKITPGAPHRPVRQRDRHSRRSDRRPALRRCRGIGGRPGR